VAGLVAVTPASGFVTPMAALMIGALAGVFCYFMTTTIKKRFGYDDSLDVFGIHGAGGTLGALLTGVFASRIVNPIFKDAPVGMLEGNSGQMINQVVGVLISIAVASVGSLIILKFVDLMIGVRVNPETEVTGLDITQHGEEGYDLAG
jgi:Amt family ammonium transporter